MDVLDTSEWGRSTGRRAKPMLIPARHLLDLLALNPRHGCLQLAQLRMHGAPLGV
jgi:hypothetical protein